MSYSMDSKVDSALNEANLHINGVELVESGHWTSSESGLVRSTGGRVLTLDVSAGDKIDLRADQMSSNGNFWYILYCAEYITKM